MKKPYYRIDKKNKQIKILKKSTVLHLHRYLQDLLDKWSFNDKAALSIVDDNVSIRVNDKHIVILGDWEIINKRDLKGKLEYDRETNIRTRSI